MQVKVFPCWHTYDSWSKSKHLVTTCTFKLLAVNIRKALKCWSFKTLSPSFVKRIRWCFMVSPFLSPADSFKPPQRSVEKPFRLCVSDVFKGQRHQSTLTKTITHFLTFSAVTVRLLCYTPALFYSSRTPARFLLCAVCLDRWESSRLTRMQN